MELLYPDETYVEQWNGRSMILPALLLYTGFTLLNTSIQRNFGSYIQYFIGSFFIMTLIFGTSIFIGILYFFIAKKSRIAVIISQIIVFILSIGVILLTPDTSTLGVFLRLLINNYGGAIFTIGVLYELRLASNRWKYVTWLVVLVDIRSSFLSPVSSLFYYETSELTITLEVISFLFLVGGVFAFWMMKDSTPAVLKRVSQNSQFGYIFLGLVFGILFTYTNLTLSTIVLLAPYWQIVIFSLAFAVLILAVIYSLWVFLDPKLWKFILVLCLLLVSLVGSVISFSYDVFVIMVSAYIILAILYILITNGSDTLILGYYLIQNLMVIVIGNLYSIIFSQSITSGDNLYSTLVGVQYLFKDWIMYLAIVTLAFAIVMGMVKKELLLFDRDVCLNCPDIPTAENTDENTEYYPEFS